VFPLPLEEGRVEDALQTLLFHKRAMVSMLYVILTAASRLRKLTPRFHFRSPTSAAKLNYRAIALFPYETGPTATFSW
jgi:hypothetical protein